MIIVLKAEATETDAKDILAKIESVKLKPLFMPGTERIVLGALGDERVLQSLNIGAHPMVENVKPILSSYKQVSREIQSHDTLVQFGKTTIGGGSFLVIAGPCAVESEEQILQSTRLVKQHGASAVKAGAFKPRTSPYSFQGLEEKGLKLLKSAAEQYQLPCVSEIIDTNHVELMSQYVDAFQIGSRNMQNFNLLKAVGQTQVPILLKRGMSATIEELLLAAEYIYSEGNTNIIICERGIRTFEKAYNNTLDLNAVAFIKNRSHLPVIVDPSHGVGIKPLITPMSKAAIACGADGLMIEAHHNPQSALTDGQRALDETEFEQFMDEIKPFIHAAGKTLSEQAST